MGVGETGVGEMGVGETGIPRLKNITSMFSLIFPLIEVPYDALS